MPKTSFQKQRIIQLRNLLLDCVRVSKFLSQKKTKDLEDLTKFIRLYSQNH